MASGVEEKNRDLYSVLGLKKECSELELRSAYKKLALRWHPDRCSASGNSKFIEEAKIKFQGIQEAYSVLSDTNKRFLYDLGIYDSNDEENGMSDFLAEMAVMMSQTKPSESFKELQGFFYEVFQQDMDCFDSFLEKDDFVYSASCPMDIPNKLKRSRSENSNVDESSIDFLFGAHGIEDLQKSNSPSKQRSGRKQKISTGHDVTSGDLRR